MALVIEPLWVSAFCGWRPKWLVMLVPRKAYETPVQQRWADLVTGMADAVLAESESLYLQLCFRRNGVIFWDPYRSWEERRQLAIQVIETLVERGDPERMAVDQRHSLLRDYEMLADREDVKETAYYLMALYRYLLADSRAQQDLLTAFERAVEAGRPNSLITHYRFLSAILAQCGRVEEAVQAYGITAVDERAKEEYDRLVRWFEEGQGQLVRARLFLLNDDIRSARVTLGRLDGEAARRLSMEADIRAGRLEEALCRLTPGDRKSRAARRAIAVQEGLLHWMRGDRAEAIHQFLRAAVEDPGVLGYVLEMGDAEEILERIGRRGGGYDAARAQSLGQSVDGHDAGAQ